MDVRPQLTRCLAQDTAMALDELTGTPRTCQEECRRAAGNVNTFVETPDRDERVDVADAEVVEK